MHKISTQVVCVNGQRAPQHQKHDQIGKSPFALSYILRVCCAGYQVCSAWKLHTQVLLIFKIHSESVNAIFFIVLNSDADLLKIRMISWWSQNRVWREGLGSVSSWVGSTADTFRHPRLETEPKRGRGRGCFHNSAPFSHEFCIPRFCHHLPKYHFLSQSHILAQIFLTKLAPWVASTTIFC